MALEVYANCYRHDGTPAGTARMVALSIQRAINEAVTISGSLVPGDQVAARALAWGNRARFYSSAAGPRGGAVLLAEGYITSATSYEGHADSSRDFQAVGLLLEWQRRWVFPSIPVRDKPLLTVLRQVAGLVGTGWHISLSGDTDSIRYSGEFTAGNSAYGILQDIADEYGFTFFAAPGRVLHFGDFSPRRPLYFRAAPVAGGPLAPAPGEAWIEWLEFSEEGNDVANRIIPYMGQPAFGLTLSGAATVGVAGGAQVKSDRYYGAPRYYIENEQSIARYGVLEEAVSPPFLVALAGESPADALYRWAVDYLAKRSMPRISIRARARGAAARAAQAIGRPSILRYTTADGQVLSAEATVTRSREAYTLNGASAEYELNSAGVKERTLALALAGQNRQAPVQQLILDTVRGRKTLRFKPRFEAEPSAEPGQLPAPQMGFGSLAPGDQTIDVEVAAVRGASGYTWGIWSYSAEPKELTTELPRAIFTTANTGLQLLSGTTYYVKVMALSSDPELADSPWSATASAVPFESVFGDQEVAMPPWGQDSVFAQDRQVALDMPLAIGARDYTVRYAMKPQPGDSPDWVIAAEEATGDAYPVTELTNGTTYIFQVMGNSHDSIAIPSDWTPAREATPQPDALEITIPDDLVSIVAARATLTRSSTYPNNIALWWNDRALDVPIFFAGGDRLSEAVDILAALEGRYAQGETNSAWIDFGQGRNGIANYSPDLPAAEQGEFAVSISIELLAVRRAGGAA